jgi:GT2 family glycosyltransferase
LIKNIAGHIKRWSSFSIDCQLESLFGIDSTEYGSWVWGEGKSQLTLMPKSRADLVGYYMLELTVSNVFKPFSCCLRLGNGSFGEINDFSEDDSVKLRVPAVGAQGKTIKRILFFDSNTKKSCVELGDEAGSCSDLSIKLVKLTRVKAKSLIRKKIITNGSVSLSEISINELYKTYNRLFQKPASISYQSWIAANEKKLCSGANFALEPTISIICPTYNTKPEWLVSCIESVKNQEYKNWQLILVDDASTNTSHFDYLKKCSEEDSRIQTVFLEKNGHISAATNAGIDLATGEYITFLDHDDELALNALAEFCAVINARPNVKIIYSDEDLMSEAGERIYPHFKSDWNIELLRAHNYITHLCCYKAELLCRLGGMRLGYEGAQDYDLILRASAVVEAEDVHHISKVLYHWRMVEGSTALSAGAKSYATEAGFKALEDHVLKLDVGAKVHHANQENFYTVKYSLPSSLPKVSIIIPTRDGMDVLKPCIDTLISETAYSNYEVIILDNGSVKKETLSYLAKLSARDNFKIIRDDGEFNYSRINNRAASYADGDLICLLNNDIEIIQSDWLCEMVSLAVKKDIGCVGAKLLYPDGTIQHAGVILGLGGYAAHSHRGLPRDKPGYFCRAQVRQQLSAVTAACLLIKRSIYEEVGGLDEAFQVAYNDVDFCLRVQALGYQNIYTPFAELIHHESKTRGEDTGSEKIKRFDKEKQLLTQRWSGQLENDPFYSPNLTRANEQFSLGGDA